MNETEENPLDCLETPSCWPWCCVLLPGKPGPPFSPEVAATAGPGSQGKALAETVIVVVVLCFCVYLICCQLLNAQASSTTRAFQVSQGGQGAPGASEQGASAGSPHPYWFCGLQQVKETDASRARWLPVSDALPALPAGSVRGAVEGGGAPWQPHSPHWLCLAGQLPPGGAAGVAVEWGLQGVVAQGLCPAL